MSLGGLPFSEGKWRRSVSSLNMTVFCVVLVYLVMLCSVDIPGRLLFSKGMWRKSVSGADGDVEGQGRVKGGETVVGMECMREEKTKRE